MPGINGRPRRRGIPAVRKGKTIRGRQDYRGGLQAPSLDLCRRRRAAHGDLRADPRMARPPFAGLEEAEMEVRGEPCAGPKIEQHERAFHAASGPPRRQHGQQALQDGFDQIEIECDARSGARSKLADQLPEVRARLVPPYPNRGTQNEAQRDDCRSGVSKRSVHRSRFG